MAHSQHSDSRVQPARVAKSADAKDLKSFFRQRECGFKSHPGHHKTLGFRGAAPQRFGRDLRAFH
jgi:hypothetical protein